MDAERGGGGGAAALGVFEVDAGENAGLANAHEVHELPALYLYAADGEFHARVEAPPDPDCLLAAVRGALGRPPEEPP